MTSVRDLAFTASLGMLGFTAPAWAGPAVAHWTVTDIGSLGGQSAAIGVNDAGQVTGNSYLSTGAAHAVLYSNGSLRDLGTLGGLNSLGYGIDSAGQVVGYSNATVRGVSSDQAFVDTNGTMSDLGTLGGLNSYALAISASGSVAGYSNLTSSTVYHAFLYVNGVMTDLGTLAGGVNSEGWGINSVGQVTGYSNIANGQFHAFLYSNGTMTDLGTLGGPSSSGAALNDAGQVTGKSYTNAGWNHAFLYSNGAMKDLGTLGGTYSIGNGINGAGQVTGQSTTAVSGGTYDAFLYSNCAMIDLNTVNGVAGSGWTLSAGYGINNVGQIVGQGSFSGGTLHGFLLTLDTTVWTPNSSGNWDDAGGWSYGIAPNLNTQVDLDPARSVTVTGPAANTQVKALTIGGDATGNNGIATLSLNGGTITVNGLSGRFTTVTAKGVLTGDGVLTGAVTNLGTVTAQNLTLAGGLTNQGLVNGSGRLGTNLANTASGTVQTLSGQTLVLSGTGHTNAGLIDIEGGGRLQVSGSLANLAGGRIAFDGGTATFSGGLSNSGQVLVTYGGATVFGNVTTNAGGQVILSGNSQTTFYDSVDVASGGELRVSAGSVATFFALVHERTGSLFTGTGTKFYEGGLSVGDSPGYGSDAGDVVFGAGNTFLAEIGGTTACTAACAAEGAATNGSYDRYVVAGHLSLGGTLELTAWDGFAARAGQSFDLLDWGSASGRFDTIDASGLQLGPGLRLDTSQLYVDGTISVQAVPEPASWMLMAAGLATLARRSRRRCDRASRARAGDDPA